MGLYIFWYTVLLMSFLIVILSFLDKFHLLYLRNLTTLSHTYTQIWHFNPAQLFCCMMLGMIISKPAFISSILFSFFR